MASTHKHVDNYKFEGWMGLDKNSIGNMKWQEYEPKKWAENDIDIKITHSGICGSDLHLLRAGWYEPPYPCVVGHEIVGTAVRVGSQVEGGIKVGDRVGVGAQSDSCLKSDCYECSSGLENHCQRPEKANTYGAYFKDGSKTQGGHARYWRGPSHFVFKVPEGLDSAVAAPMMCGGITAYSPLVNNGAGPKKRVGVVGVGGIGHFAIVWAKALGCPEIVAISRTSAKKEDAMKLGATKFIATDEDKDWATHHANSIDLIICTASSPKMPLEGYLQLLTTKARFINIGAPDDPWPAFHPFALLGKGVMIGGSAIGPPEQIREMLEFAAKHNVKPWIEQRPMEDANQALKDLVDNKVRYRYTLVNKWDN